MATSPVLKQVAKGQAVLLTYRGKPVARLEPVQSGEVSADDPVYQLDQLASPTAEPLINADIDRAVYGA
ncbi:MAG TPA: type II toxin-antitoxin system prevent-host-death family antitoxin [Pirellulales bacterium]|nr:type II toxin-antitoxin system prevent-host-death family antitoxin [Pirellulales bacterium]